MLEIFHCEQGSDEWFNCRLDIPTASRFSDVLAKGAGKTRRKYMLELAAQRITGEPAESYSNPHMERGKIMEEEARQAYAFMTDNEPFPVGFIRRGEVGCSPDSLIGDDGLLEIKTKLPHLQIEALLANKLPTTHKPQVQGQLWVAERQWCDFVSYWPKLPMLIVRVERDEEYIKMLESEVDRFLKELSETVEQIKQRYAA